MSETLRELLLRERNELIEQQRVCAWCGKDCEDADWLFCHILLRHPKEAR